jgi:regulator of replication initiation timing
MKNKCCDQGLVVAIQDNEDANNSGRNLAETINSLSAVVTDMKKVIEELIRENKKFRQEIEAMKSDKQQAKSADLDMNDMGVDEAMDRIRRANNIIIRGIPKAGSNSQAEIQTVKNLISSVVPDNNQKHFIMSVTIFLTPYWNVMWHFDFYCERQNFCRKNFECQS